MSSVVNRCGNYFSIEVVCRRPDRFRVFAVALGSWADLPERTTTRSPRCEFLADFTTHTTP